MSDDDKKSEFAQREVNIQEAREEEKSIEFIREFIRPGLDRYLKETDIIRTKKEEEIVVRIAKKLLKDKICPKDLIDQEFGNSLNELREWKQKEIKKLESFNNEIESSKASDFFPTINSDYYESESTLLKAYDDYLFKTNMALRYSEESTAKQLLSRLFKEKILSKEGIEKEHEKRLDKIKERKISKTGMYQIYENEFADPKWGEFYTKLVSKNISM